MGYRSDVAMVILRSSIDAPSVPEMLALAKTAGVITDTLFADHWNDEDYGWTEDRLAFHVTDVKWYESYAGVRGIEDLWAFFAENLGDDDRAYEGKFVRIGEESQDIEEKEFGWGSDTHDMVYVNRSIEVDFRKDILGNQRQTETC